MPNIDQTNRDLPPAQGLYHPRNEHDACGLNFVCDMHGRKSHEIVAKAIGALCNLEHRGARGADINTGDGAGILIQVPDRFFATSSPSTCPRPAPTPPALRSCPRSRAWQMRQREVESILEAEGLMVLGWRDVPIDESILARRRS